LGTLLAATLWVIWLERNKRIFQSSSGSRAASIYFHILYLYECWTGSLTELESMVAAMAAPLHSTALSLPRLTSDGDVDDEDLLD